MSVQLRDHSVACGAAWNREIFLIKKKWKPIFCYIAYPWNKAPEADNIGIWNSRTTLVFTQNHTGQAGRSTIMLWCFDTEIENPINHAYTNMLRVYSRFNHRNRFIFAVAIEGFAEREKTQNHAASRSLVYNLKGISTVWYDLYRAANENRKTLWSSMETDCTGI